MEKTILTKKVMCETQVLREQIVDTIAVQILLDRGLNIFFNKIEGYHRGVCVEFYRNMTINTTRTIRSKVRGKTIVVIADTISQYLQYPRPDLVTIQFLKGGFNPLTEQAYAHAIYMDPADIKVGGKFLLRKFKLEYKLMTKIIHFNIALTRSKKELNWLTQNYYI